MAENVFEVDNLSLYYLGRFGDKTHAVTNVSFSMKQGEILGIAGESGCGKSTLVSGFMGMCIPPLYPEKPHNMGQGSFSILQRSDLCHDS